MPALSPFRPGCNRDLGYLYVTAMELDDEGKDEFAIALNLDSTVVLPFLQQTGAATKPFCRRPKARYRATLREEGLLAIRASLPDSRTTPTSPQHADPTTRQSSTEWRRLGQR